MTLIDFILNIAGLLLWLNWRAAELPVRSQPGRSLVATLRPAGPPRPRLYYWAILPALLVARAVFYWQVGQPVHWSPQIPLGPITLAFRSDLPGRMILFSVLSFGVTLGVFYCWLLVLSCVNGRIPKTDPAQRPVERLVGAWLGRFERWPGPVKLLLPLVVAALAWALLNPLLSRLDMVPSYPLRRLLLQGGAMGLNVFLTVKFPIVALLVLYLVNSYVYLGDFTLWLFVNTTARRLLRPLQWLPLRLGKIDFVPVLLIVLVLAATELARRGLSHLYQQMSW